jgi:hypothetical protein
MSDEATVLDPAAETLEHSGFKGGASEPKTDRCIFCSCSVMIGWRCATYLEAVT